MIRQRRYLAVGGLWATPAGALASGVLGVPGTWGGLSVVAMGGGMALLLLGMETMSGSLKRLAAGKLAEVLSRVSKRRLVALGVGALVTAAIQSSTATTVILVSLVEAQVMTFSQTIPIVLGSNVGTTLSAQVLAFKVTDYAFLLIGGGFFLRTLVRRRFVRAVGETVMGLGMAFLGIGVMSTAMSPLRTSPPVQTVVRYVENVPIGILVGTVFTALIHSSAATIGILLSFASQGLVSLKGSLPVIFGANVGTCFTAVLASLQGSREAKRVAVVHTLFNVGGVLLFLFWMPEFAELIERISPKAPEGLSETARRAMTVPRQVANAHTVFNFSVAFLFLPLTRMAGAWTRRLVPDAPGVRTYHLDRNLLKSFSGSPSLALMESLGALRVAVDITRDVLSKGMSLVTRGEVPAPEAVRKARQPLLALRRDVNDYLNALSALELDREQSLNATRQALVVAELDHIAQAVVTVVETIQDVPANFSAQGRKELMDYYQRTLKLYEMATQAFLSGSKKASQEAGEFKRELKAVEDMYRRNHIARMRSQIKEAIETDAAHMDLLDALRQVNTYSGRIARVLADETEDSTLSPARILTKPEEVA